jgi:4-hydroxy-tetrahydrodipicolinate synthase
MSEIRGVLTAIATPFEPGGAVDEAAARRLASHLVEHGSHGIVVAGSSGEAATLDDEEHIALLAAIVDEIGGEATVICGTGTNDTRHSVELTKAAAEAGADGALVVTPYYNKPTFPGIRAHYEAIAAAVPGLPLIAYNIPSRVVINVSPTELAELAKIDSVVAVKQAENQELQLIEGMALLAGNDDGFMRVLELGGAGGILVASNLVGPQMRKMWDAAQAGDLERAREIDGGLRKLYDVLGIVTNPIPLKAALAMTGLIPNGGLRLPMVEADAQQRAAVREALDAVGIAVAS